MFFFILKKKTDLKCFLTMNVILTPFTVCQVSHTNIINPLVKDTEIKLFVVPLKRIINAKVSSN